MLSPGTEFYTKLGEECVKAGVSVDLFFFPSAHIDLASIAPVATLTGGSIYKYQYFDVSDFLRFEGVGQSSLQFIGSNPLYFRLRTTARVSSPTCTATSRGPSCST